MQTRMRDAVAVLGVMAKNYERSGRVDAGWRKVLAAVERLQGAVRQQVRAPQVCGSLARELEIQLRGLADGRVNRQHAERQLQIFWRTQSGEGLSPARLEKLLAPVAGKGVRVDAKGVRVEAKSRAAGLVGIAQRQSYNAAAQEPDGRFDSAAGHASIPMRDARELLLHYVLTDMYGFSQDDAAGIRGEVQQRLIQRGLHPAQTRKSAS